MATVNTYLNFNRSTAEAFEFYRSVFKTDYALGPMRFKDMPPQPGCPPVPAADGDLVMHVALPILGGFLLMGSDTPESMGSTVKSGNNVFINLQPDTRAETDRLFAALSAGGKADMPLQDMFWGAYFGTCTDKFGVQWMFNCESKQ